MKIRDIGEIGLIKRLTKGIRLDKSVVKGPGDDTAVVKWTKGKFLLFTCDILVENVHFKRNSTTPFQIGWKALCRNISDIAAMGGVPKYAVVSVAMDRNLPVSFADGISKGLRAAANRFGVNIVGGDVSSSSSIVIDVSLIGEVEKRCLVTRSDAKKGDRILLTGSIGGSIKRKHLNFTPRLKESRMLVRNFKINSMIDVSDGLVLDLWRILDSSKCGARICEDAIPISKDADSFAKAITDGEDFELLFTMGAAETKRFFKSSLSRMDIPISLVGEITDKKKGYIWVDRRGREGVLRPKGYLHF